MQCGVGQFTRLLQETIEKLDPGSSTTLTLTRTEGSIADIWRAIGAARSVVCNFPIVAWKRVILRPLLALAFARMRGRRVILIQHEWASLHWLRRVTYLPALLLANTVIMFSPQVRRELARDPLVGWTAAKCVMAPLPPNIEAPSQTADTPLRQKLKAARQNGRLVIGHFGSIYPGKQPNTLLDITAILRERGHNPLTVYVGSFIKAFDNVEQDFLCAPERAWSLGGRHRQRLCRIQRRGVRIVRRGRCLLLSARRRPDGAARQHPDNSTVRSSRNRDRTCRSRRIRPPSSL